VGKHHNAFAMPVANKARDFRSTKACRMISRASPRGVWLAAFPFWIVLLKESKSKARYRFLSRTMPLYFATPSAGHLQ
jgi:hypothetical protein